MKISTRLGGLLIVGMPLASCGNLPRPSAAILPNAATPASVSPPKRDRAKPDPVARCFALTRKIARQQPHGAVGFCDQGNGTTLTIEVDHEGNVIGSRVSSSQILQP